MTWTMIKQQNELNAHIEKKNQLIEEFEKFKKNVIIKTFSIIIKFYLLKLIVI